MDTLHAAASAMHMLFMPLRLEFLCVGVLLGLVIGIVPGLGGIVGLSLLLPFTFKMDPYSAMAILMGMTAAVSHADVIPAILFGVPGTVGCAATVMDGHPMAKRGEAGRALGAAFSASLLGGLCGAALLAVTIPIIRPVILLFGSPEMLAICIFGLTLVASLSSNAPLKGLTVASIGLLLSMIGTDSQTGTQRFTFGTLYLWDGLPLVPVALAIFAIPELCDIMIKRTSIAQKGNLDTMRGQGQGWRDTFSNWFLVARTAVLGTACGMVPGLGAAVIDWIAYGHAVKTEKHPEMFGKGDVRGVIAAESSTNAREGGSLIPTIAFGVPAHPSMAILLGAFLIQGIVPGPDMLSTHLDVTYTIVWSLALANVLGTVICFALANQFARIATIRYTLLVPIITVLVYLGAFEGQHSWGDIIALLALGMFAWLMKRCGWPRAPLLLGFILGSLIERYTFISVESYGWHWITHWFVMLMFAIVILSISRQMLANMRIASLRSIKVTKLRNIMTSIRRPQPSLALGLALFVLTLFIGTLYLEARWSFAPRLVPQIISMCGIVFGVLLTAGEVLRMHGNVESPARASRQQTSDGAPRPDSGDSHLSYGSLTDRDIYGRAAGYFLWALGLLLVAYLIGLLPAFTLFIFAFLLFHGKENWHVALGTSLGSFAFLWFVFEHVVHEPWPQTVADAIFPSLRSIIPWL